jgi:hypothetical protein
MVEKLCSDPHMEMRNLTEAIKSQTQTLGLIEKRLAETLQKREQGPAGFEKASVFGSGGKNRA